MNARAILPGRGSVRYCAISESDSGRKSSISDGDHERIQFGDRRLSGTRVVPSPVNLMEWSTRKHVIAPWGN